MAECPSRFTLVQHEVGDLPSAEGEALSAHLAQCAVCQQRLAELQRNRGTYESRQQEHLAALHARLSAEQQPAEQRPARARSRWLRLAPAVGGLAAAAAVALYVLPDVLPGLPGSEAAPELGVSSSDVQFKGTVTVQIVARRNGRQFEVAPGVELKPEDALRFVVTSSSSGYVSVFSIDAEQRVSPFYPDSDPSRVPEPMALTTAGRHELPGSIVLDRVSGDECFVVAFSEQRFDRERVHEQALASAWYREMRTPGKGETGPGLDLRVMWVKKRP